jgi:hypothetical protein
MLSGKSQRYYKRYHVLKMYYKMLMKYDISTYLK